MTIIMRLWWLKMDDIRYKKERRNHFHKQFLPKNDFNEYNWLILFLYNQIRDMLGVNTTNAQTVSAPVPVKDGNASSKEI